VQRITSIIYRISYSGEINKECSFRPLPGYNAGRNGKQLTTPGFVSDGG
jgi:hypothetical protein